MKLLKLEILNLASLDKADGETINFEEGALGESTIFSIVGPTGSGKSTILDAICLALYNRAPRYPRKKGESGKIEIYGMPKDGEKNRLAPTDGRNILTRGRKTGYSKLTFLANNGMVYRAEWHVNMKNKNFDNVNTLLYKITIGKDETNEEICQWDDLPQIIGLDYEQFLRTVLIAQGSFANFLTAKENERYELLEKLVGCEQLYTNIADKIKRQKDKATDAYNEVAAIVSAQEKDIIPEEQLAELNEKIKQLEEKDTKIKAEIAKVTEDIGWYEKDEKLSKNIAKYNLDMENAKANLNAIEQEADLLKLHDNTLAAVSYYKDMKTAKANIDSHDASLKKLHSIIDDEKKNIEDEEKTLDALKESAKLATDNLSQQKPHIDKAREIKGQLAGAITNLSEKQKAKNDAECAAKKATKAIEANAKLIAAAKKEALSAEESLKTLNEEIKKQKNELTAKVKIAQEAFDIENQKAKLLDAETLQTIKCKADKKLSDIKEAIRIRTDIGSHNKTISEAKAQQTSLTKRNKDIDAELSMLKIDELAEDLKTLQKSHDIMMAGDMLRLRSELRDNEPCPLCGAIHHPYANSNFVSIVNELDLVIEKKEKELKEQNESRDKLNSEKSRNDGELKGINDKMVLAKGEMQKLYKDWDCLQTAYPDWHEETEWLLALQPSIDEEAKQAENNLKAFNNLTKNIEKLRMAKDKANDNLATFVENAETKIKASEEEYNKAQTAIKTEEGKTENLISQQKEKTESLSNAKADLDKAQKEIESKQEAMKAEIGTADPDTLEASLNKVKDDATLSVDQKSKAIGSMREQLKVQQGNVVAIQKQLTTENENYLAASKSLNEEIANYNADANHCSAISIDDIAYLYAATNDWEAIRSRHQQLQNVLTTAETTLKNAQREQKEHLTKKPEATKEELNEHKHNLDNYSNVELVNDKARLQLHNKAKQQLGETLTNKQEAEKLKTEWEQISNAVGGSDGKLLRKIAQCYTLRFLIEHANVEIRKFNSRYELQQVKNSLGIRVVDHDRADDVRDTTSLSGGETFIVSLGLALGLSSLSSRNISFENLFIDEGFGTLDPETLATVIDSLAMLQSSQGKKVGVISHTDTMSERISTQIRVIKNGNSGSSHIEIYPRNVGNES